MMQTTTLTRLVQIFIFMALIGLAVPPVSAQECSDAVQGKIAWNYDGSTRWAPTNIETLCGGAPNSKEPARCFQQVMHSGEVDWGGGTKWSWKNAVNLCRGTRNADGLIQCFEEQVESGESWSNATEICRERESKGELPMNYAPTASQTIEVLKNVKEDNPDADGDAHASVEAGGDDCDDSDPNRFPGNVEVADTRGHDEDCDPATIGTDGDRDGDGFIDQAVFNMLPSGLRNTGRDCDDTDPSIHPHGKEVCNGMDDDCDGNVDEGVMAQVFRDNDGDLFGDPDRSQLMCPQKIQTPWVLNNTDCDDSNRKVNPAAGGCQN